MYYIHTWYILKYIIFNYVCIIHIVLYTCIHVYIYCIIYIVYIYIHIQCIVYILYKYVYIFLLCSLPNFLWQSVVFQNLEFTLSIEIRNASFVLSQDSSGYFSLLCQIWIQILGFFLFLWKKKLLCFWEGLHGICRSFWVLWTL